MRPQKIHLSGIPGLTLLILSWTSLLVPLHTLAQATCGGTTQTTTYSAPAVHGSGSDSYTISLPQFYSPEGYTLMSIELDAYLTATANLSVQNTNPTAVNFFAGFTRVDEIDLNGGYFAGGNGAYTYTPRTSLAKAGMPGDSKTYPPTQAFNNYNIVNYAFDGSDPNTGYFMGSSSVSLDYYSYTNVSQPAGVIPTSSFADDITLSVTYTFCNPIILSPNIITFTAVRQDPQTVLLNWLSSNEKPGRLYVLEVSKDGKSFQPFYTQDANSSYSDAGYTHNYAIDAAATGKLFFRLKQVEPDGAVSYSSLRIIDLDAGAGGGDFSIYPNPPTNFINVRFPASDADWQVDILTSVGSLVQRNAFHNTATGRVNFLRVLSAGTYFVRATNLRTAQSRTASFVIR